MAIQRSAKIGRPYNVSATFEFLEGISNFFQSDRGISAEIEFERRCSFHWKRVHHCLLFPRTQTATAAYYAGTQRLLNHGTGRLDIFNKRAPSTTFRLLNARDLWSHERTHEGIYSYGPYLDENNRLQPSLLLAHVFTAAEGAFSQQLADISNNLSALSCAQHEIAVSNQSMLNMYCCCFRT